MEPSLEQQNKDLVLKAFHTLFNQRDFATAEGFWSPDYIQHSADIEAGRHGLFDLVRNTPSTLRYQPGLILAGGEWVILHGRFSAFGHTANWIAVDIVRLNNGLLVEHWDVLQDEVTAEQSKSKRPMFGTSFPIYK